MKIAYTGWTWMMAGPEATAEQKIAMFEQSVKEISYLGYEVNENFAFISQFLPAETAKAICEKYNCPLVNVYGHFTTDKEFEVANAKKQIDWLAEVGGKWFNCQSSVPRPQPKKNSDHTDDDAPVDTEVFDDMKFHKEETQIMADICNELGEYANKKGVTVCFHPHAMTYVFNRESIDYFAQQTNPEYVKFCFDTAHTTLAGIDPVELCATYGERVGYMHLKDVDPSHDAEKADAGQKFKRGKMGAFRALGLGCVNFKGVVEALKSKGYDGVLCVELDNPEICNFRSAQISRAYIKDVLKL